MDAQDRALDWAPRWPPCPPRGRRTPALQYREGTSNVLGPYQLAELFLPPLNWSLMKPSLTRPEYVVRHALEKYSQKKRYERCQRDQDLIFISVDPMELDCEQLLYQIPNNRVLTSKIGLLSCLREQERVMKKVGRSSNSKLLKMEEFFPESFRLDLKDERNAFFEICKEEQIWICKPSCSNQGRGIFLLKNPAAANTLQAKLHSSERDLPSKRVQCRAPQARIVQRYIHQPLLLEGKKFDVRSYLLIACTAPYVLFFAQGYVRLTCTSYDAMSDDLTVHLTNQYMQKKNSLYSQLKDETVWRMEHFNSYVNEKFTKTDGLPKDWVFTVFTKRMQQIMLQCFLAAKHKLDRKLGYFDLIGCDFLIDENFKVWLLEMNANPALHTDCKVLRDIIPTVVYESLDLVLEIFNKCLKGRSVLPLETRCHFVLLYNEDAADLGQKQLLKLRPRLCMGRYLRPHTDSASYFGHSPTKEMDASSKKLGCSKRKVALLPKKTCQQTVS